MTSSVGQARVPKEFIEQTVIPLPPLDIQRDLVAALDVAISKGASAAAHLATARRAIGRFRQVILTAACSGRLTGAGPKEDSFEELRIDLGQVRLRRRAEQGGRFREPELNPYAEIAELPDHWHLAPLGLLLSEIKYGTSQRSEYGVPGVSVLRIPNVSGDRLDITDLKFADLSQREREDLSLRVDDVLMIRSNGSVQLVGRAMKVTDDAVGMAYAGYLMRLRPDSQVLDSTYLTLAMAAYQVRLQIEMPARSTSGVHNINTQEVRNLGIPLPPLEEQQEIVRRASAILHLADALLARSDAASRRIERSSQAILAKAFRGELMLEQDGQAESQPAFAALEPKS